MNIARLQRLITILQSVPPEQFDLGIWKCGTTACAVGWACADPAFIAQGLRHFPGVGPTYDKPGREPNEFYTHWRAVEEFFGLSDVQAFRLFSSHSYAADRPVPQDVADRIAALIEGNPQ